MLRGKAQGAIGEPNFVKMVKIINPEMSKSKAGKYEIQEHKDLL